jgi:cobalt-zinc-cadmium efflux system protein
MRRRRLERRRLWRGARASPTYSMPHDHHHHGPGHAHHHHHHHDVGEGAASTVQIRRLRLALGLIGGFLILEIIGAIASNSLALLADAGHMLTDVAALALSLFVAWWGQKPSTPEKTYGYLRWEILAAFLNGATLLIVSTWIVWEAVLRLQAPQPLSSGLMLWVAVAGLVVNAATAWVLHPPSGASLNFRGAYLHVLGDLLASAGTVAAAVVIRTAGWLAADPIASILMTIVIVRGAWALVRESVDVLLEATPSHISLPAVRAQLQAIPGIESIHDLHVWTVTSGMIAMSAHAVVPESPRQQHVLEHINVAMRLFGIEHVTVQLESQRMTDCDAQLHA